MLLQPFPIIRPLRAITALLSHIISHIISPKLRTHSNTSASQDYISSQVTYHSRATIRITEALVETVYLPECSLHLPVAVAWTFAYFDKVDPTSP